MKTTLCNSSNPTGNSLFVFVCVLFLRVFFMCLPNSYSLRVFLEFLEFPACWNNKVSGCIRVRSAPLETLFPIVLYHLQLLYPSTPFQNNYNILVNSSCSSKPFSVLKVLLIHINNYESFLLDRNNCGRHDLAVSWWQHWLLGIS